MNNLTTVKALLSLSFLLSSFVHKFSYLPKISVPGPEKLHDHGYVLLAFQDFIARLGYVLSVIAHEGFGTFLDGLVGFAAPIDKHRRHVLF